MADDSSHSNTPEDGNEAPNDMYFCTAPDMEDPDTPFPAEKVLLDAIKASVKKQDEEKDAQSIDDESNINGEPLDISARLAELSIQDRDEKLEQVSWRTVGSSVRFDPIPTTFGAVDWDSESHQSSTGSEDLPEFPGQAMYLPLATESDSPSEMEPLLNQEQEAELGQVVQGDAQSRVIPAEPRVDIQQPKVEHRDSGIDIFDTVDLLGTYPPRIEAVDIEVRSPRNQGPESSHQHRNYQQSYPRQPENLRSRVTAIVTRSPPSDSDSDSSSDLSSDRERREEDNVKTQVELSTEGVKNAVTEDSDPHVTLFDCLECVSITPNHSRGPATGVYEPTPSTSQPEHDASSNNQVTNGYIIGRNANDEESSPLQYAHRMRFKRVETQFIPADMPEVGNDSSTTASVFEGSSGGSAESNQQFDWSNVGEQSTEVSEMKHPDGQDSTTGAKSNTPGTNAGSSAQSEDLLCLMMDPAPFAIPMPGHSEPSAESDGGFYMGHFGESYKIFDTNTNHNVPMQDEVQTDSTPEQLADPAGPSAESNGRFCVQYSEESFRIIKSNAKQNEHVAKEGRDVTEHTDDSNTEKSSFEQAKFWVNPPEIIGEEEIQRLKTEIEQVQPCSLQMSLGPDAMEGINPSPSFLMADGAFYFTQDQQPPTEEHTVPMVENMCASLPYVAKVVDITEIRSNTDAEEDHTKEENHNEFMNQEYGYSAPTETSEAERNGETSEDSEYVVTDSQEPTVPNGPEENLLQQPHQESDYDVTRGSEELKNIANLAQEVQESMNRLKDDVQEQCLNLDLGENDELDEGISEQIQVAALSRNGFDDGDYEGGMVTNSENRGFRRYEDLNMESTLLEMNLKENDQEKPNEIKDLKEMASMVQEVQEAMTRMKEEIVFRNWSISPEDVGQQIQEAVFTHVYNIPKHESAQQDEAEGEKETDRTTDENLLSIRQEDIPNPEGVETESERLANISNMVQDLQEAMSRLKTEVQEQCVDIDQVDGVVSSEDLTQQIQIAALGSKAQGEEAQSDKTDTKLENDFFMGIVGFPEDEAPPAEESPNDYTDGTLGALDSLALRAKQATDRINDATRSLCIKKHVDNITPVDRSRHNATVAPSYLYDGSVEPMPGPSGNTEEESTEASDESSIEKDTECPAPATGVVVQVEVNGKERELEMNFEDNEDKMVSPRYTRLGQNDVTDGPLTALQMQMSSVRKRQVTGFISMTPVDPHRHHATVAPSNTDDADDSLQPPIMPGPLGNAVEESSGASEESNGEERKLEMEQEKKVSPPYTRMGLNHAPPRTPSPQPSPRRSMKRDDNIDMYATLVKMSQDVTQNNLQVSRIMSSGNAPAGERRKLVRRDTEERENILLELQRKYLPRLANKFRNISDGNIPQIGFILQDKEFINALDALRRAPYFVGGATLLELSFMHDVAQLVIDTPEVFRTFKKLLEMLFSAITEENASEFNSVIIVSSNLMTIMLNGADYDEFAQRLCKEPGLLELLVWFARHAKDHTVMSRENVDVTDIILTQSINVLYNCAMHDTNRQRLQDVGTLYACQNYMDSRKGHMQRLSLLTVAYLADEKQSEIFKAKKKPILHLVNALRKTCMEYCEGGRHEEGWSKIELIKGLGRLAVNECNKKVIADCGGVQVLLDIIQDHETQAEKLESLNVLWLICFEESVKPTIRSNKDVMDLIEMIASADHDPKCQKVAKGILWTIRDSMGHEVKEAKATGGHLMISYQWDAKELALKVRDTLKAAGYKVWMDVDEMQGSTIETMAKAVEESAVVLMCMSQRYKESQNCRSEAEYAYYQQKEIIPLVVQTKYKPDGWLGFIRGTKFYYDITNIKTYNSKMQDLMKALGDKGLTRVIAPSNQTKDLNPAPAVTNGDPMPRPPSRENTKNWEDNEVVKWMEKHGLNKERLGLLSGRQLHFLQKMKRDAPGFYYSYVNQNLYKLNEIDDFSSLTNAIEDLDETKDT